MANRVCKTCGEEYSNTYKRCPFCEEEEAIKKGHPLHRHNGGKRLEKQRQSNGGAGGVLLLITFVIIVGVIGYVLLGDRVADVMGIRSNPEELGFSTDGEGEDGKDKEKEPDAPPENPDDSTANPMTLSQEAMTIAVGETALLTVTGAEGDVEWSSSDEQIAAVSGGTVTGKAGGTVTITAVSGENSAACSVQVDGEPPVADEPAIPDDNHNGGDTTASGDGASGGSTVKLTLNKTDFSIRPGDNPVTMRVSGTDSKVTWASKDPSIAAISESGVVTRVSTGTTTITATVDGQTLECIVRCKS